jgi:excisionase family DNA binding protein
LHESALPNFGILVSARCRMCLLHTAGMFPEPINLSRKDAAQRLGVSLRTIDYLITEGKLPVRKIGRRTLIPVRTLEQFAKRDHLSVRR